MAADPVESLTRAVRGAVGGVFEATVGRVGERVANTAHDVTLTTTQQVVTDLEPFLIEQTVPRIMAGLTPQLSGVVVPDVLAGIQEHLIQVAVPEIVDGLHDHLVRVTVPAVVAGLTPQLVDELLPDLLTQLRPYLETELVPRVVDSLMPRLRESVAPELVDSLMPKIRQEVVPAVLDDIVDDPRVRDLIREQSQGLLLDAVERGRRGLAGADDLVEVVARRLLGRPRRPGPSPDAPVPLPGRKYGNAGLVTRGVALAIDLTMASWLLSQSLAALLGVITSVFGSPPTWVVALLTAGTASLVPFYLGVTWWLFGASLGNALVGLRICTADGRNPRPLRALVRSWLVLASSFIWVAAMLPSLFDPRRRGSLDRITRTEVRYFVHPTQQRRRSLPNRSAA